MHDIGKVRTPLEILNKPDKLTDAEFAIMKRHTVDGAEILRKTPDIPALAPVVAFEHHLRLDGTGYPERRHAADAESRHDAVQHRRRLRRHAIAARVPAGVPDRSHPRSAEAERRHSSSISIWSAVSSQLIGIYPVGNLVRLNTGEIAVVMKVYAPDPLRPQVRVLFDARGKRVSPLTLDLNLWERDRSRSSRHRLSRRSIRRTTRSIR